MANYYKKEAVRASHPSLDKAKKNIKDIMKKHNTNNMDYAMDYDYSSPQYKEIKKMIDQLNEAEKMKSLYPSGRIVEGYISPRAKIKRRSVGTNADSTMSMEAKREGYDVLEIYKGKVLDEVVVINPKIIKTKTQLKEIWNKANKK